MRKTQNSVCVVRKRSKGRPSDGVDSADLGFCPMAGQCKDQLCNCQVFKHSLCFVVG
jgi:hypothetical protein